MAKVTKAFEGYYAGEHVLVRFEVGDEVRDGSNLHRVALEQGWCKAKRAPKNKALGEFKNKSGSASHQGQASSRKTLKRSKSTTAYS